jgi:outer membrane lipoprotein-sorting protein
MNPIRTGLWAALLVPVVLRGADPTSQDVIRNVERMLDEKKTVKAKFEELYVWKLTGERQSLRGEFLLSGTAKFRIATDDQVIVSDGATLWTYSKPANRVLVDKVEGAESDWLPQKLFLQTQKAYRHRLAGRETVEGKPCLVVEFHSPDGDVFITGMKVWVEEGAWIPRKIEQTDIGKNKTVYTLIDVQTGVLIEDSAFKPVQPDGAEIIDLR